MEQQPRLPLWFLVVNCSLIAIAFLAGAFLGPGRGVAFPEPQDRALQAVYDQIMAYHVQPQDGAELLDRAIAAMARVDDYSRYVPPSEVTHYEEVSTGRYEGIGAVFRLHGEAIVIHFPYPGSPAERAGIRPGDRLVAIDGTEVASLPPAERSGQTVELIRGPANSTVELQLRRGEETVVAQVERDGVQKPVVKWAHLADPEDGLGYLYVSDFHRGLTTALDDAIVGLQADARAEGTTLRGLILDIRWNGGGNFDECVATARMFQPAGVIVSTRRRGEELERQEADRAQCRHPDLPIVLLVNGDSASASEVLAGCLQDHGRARVVGTRTYGKGVVNTIYSWSDFKLKLTTGHFYTPKGRSLGGPTRQRRSPHGDGGESEVEYGIAPDVVTEIPDETARAVLQRLAAQDVPRAHREAFAAVAAEFEFDVPTPPRAADDPQLEVALRELRQRVAAAGTIPGGAPTNGGGK